MRKKEMYVEPKRDIIAEMTTSEKGSVKCIGKFVISPRRQTIEGMPLIMIIGAAVSPEGGSLVQPEDDGWSEMWECELILMPKRKYSSLRKDGARAFAGCRADQILSSDYGSPGSWGKKIYDLEEKP